MLKKFNSLSTFLLESDTSDPLKRIIFNFHQLKNHPALAFFRQPKCFSSFGLVASLLLLLTLWIPQFDYLNQDQQPFSILNHFVSELGWFKVSDKAYLFSLGLIIGGILLLPFAYGFGQQLHGKYSDLTFILLFLTSIGCCMVGLFPMDFLLLHGFGAFTFFASAYSALILLGILTFNNRVHQIPKFYSILSTFIVFVIISHLFSHPLEDIKLYVKDMHTDLKIINRPKYWILPFVEWCTVLFFLFYVITISITYLIKSNRASSQ
jgi:hypothetical membrane protein